MESSVAIHVPAGLKGLGSSAADVSGKQTKRRKPELRRVFSGLRSRFGDIALAFPFPLAILALWWITAQQGWVAEQILPSPLVVASTFADLWSSGDITSNLSISLLRVVYGFLLGTGLGLGLGILMGLSPIARDYLYPSFHTFAQVPSLGWLPLLMMLVGIEEALKIILIVKAVVVPVTINTYQGIGSVPTRLIEVARVYRFTRWQLLRKVVLPAAFPQIWTGVRFGLTKAWLALVAVELLASSEGLGFMLVYGRQLFQLDVVMAAVIVVGAVGFALDKLLAIVEGRLLSWRRDSF